MKIYGFHACFLLDFKIRFKNKRFEFKSFSKVIKTTQILFYGTFQLIYNLIKLALPFFSIYEKNPSKFLKLTFDKIVCT